MSLFTPQPRRLSAELIRNVTSRPEKLVAEQKIWLKQVRDKCDETACLRSTVNECIDALRRQWTDLMDSTQKKSDMPRMYLLPT